MTLARDIEVEIEYLPTEHGGRSTPVKSGYRPQFYYDGHDWDGVQTFEGIEWVSPGGKVKAFISFLSPAEHVGKLYPGKAFLIREGNRILGYGSVIRVLELEASAKRLSNENT